MYNLEYKMVETARIKSSPQKIGALEASLSQDRTRQRILYFDRRAVIDVDYRIAEEFSKINKLGQLIYRSKSSRIRSAAFLHNLI